MKKAYNSEPDYILWVLLEQAQSATFGAREKELSKYSTSPMQTAVLFIVDAIGSEATPAEVSRWLLRKSHSVSGLLDRMEKDGLVKKSKDLHRKNLVRITITNKGHKVLEQSKKRESIRRVMSVLSEEERLQLQSSLKKIRDKALRVSGAFPKPPYPKQ